MNTEVDQVQTPSKSSLGAAKKTKSKSSNIRSLVPENTNENKTTNAPENQVNTGEEQSREEVSQQQLEETSEMLNKASEVLNRNLRFNVVPSEDVVQAEIVDNENDEVIKKIPPDEILEIRERIDTFIGLFVDEQR